MAGKGCWTLVAMVSPQQCFPCSKAQPDAVFQLFLVPWIFSILTVVFFSLQTVALYASLSPSVRGPVAGHQQEVPDLQGGH